MGEASEIYDRIIRKHLARKAVLSQGVQDLLFKKNVP